MLRFKFLTISEREWYEERAAILEFDAKYDKLTAQKLALDMTERHFMIDFNQREKEFMK